MDYTRPKYWISFLLICFQCATLKLYGHIGKVVNDTMCYYVEQCGIKGDGLTDALSDLNDLIACASRHNIPVKIVFDKNKAYRIDGRGKDLYRRIFLNRNKDIVLDGNGCTLLIHPSSRAFAVYRSENIIIRNFNIDYSPLPYTQGRVTKIDSKNYYLEFVVDQGFPLPIVGDETYYKGGKMVDCITANGETNKFYQGHSWVKKVVKLGDRRFGVKYDLRDQKQLRVGDYFCMKVEFPFPDVLKNLDAENKKELNEWLFTNWGSIEALESNNLVLENITSFASPVMTFLFRGCSHHKIRGCSIIAKPGRIVAGCSDGIHLKGNEHQPLIEECYFERTMDDAIHIKISGDVIAEVLSPSRFRIVHMDNESDNTNLGVGKEVMLFDRKELKQLAMSKIIDYQAINHREGIVTLASEIDGVSKGMCLYLQGIGKALIDRCNFGTQLQRAILTHQPTKVSNCNIVDNGKGFDLALMSEGIEGPPTQFLQVENCLFENLSYVGLCVDCPSLNYDQKGKPQLLIKNCTFKLPKDIPILQIKNSQGVSLIGNKYYIHKGSSKVKLFEFQNTLLIEDSNNTYIER